MMRRGATGGSFELRGYCNRVSNIDDRLLNYYSPFVEVSIARTKQEGLKNTGIQ